MPLLWRKITLLLLLQFATLSSSADDGLKIARRSKYGCEGSTMSVRCQGSNSEIRIVRANFGRFSNDICASPATVGNNWSTNCYEPKTLRIVKEKCEGRRECDIEVKPEQFGGDPCPETFKYLEVHYICADAKVRTVTAKPVAPWLLDLTATRPTTTTRPKTTTTQMTTTTTTTTTEANDFDNLVLDYDNVEEFILDLGEDFENEATVDIDGEEYFGLCPPITERNLFWNWTLPGREAIQVCPPGSTGFARWRCGTDGHWEADYPNLSECQSHWLRRLDAEQEEDSVERLSSKLTSFTSSRSLYGGDLPAIVRLVQLLPERLSQELLGLHSQVEMEEQTFGLRTRLTQTVSDLLNRSQLFAWRDLTVGRRSRLATGMFLGLMESNLLYAQVQNREKRVEMATDNVFVDIRVKGTRKIKAEVLVDDEIDVSVPERTLIEGSDNGAVRLALFNIRNLEYVLPGLDNHFINSQVVGAAMAESSGVDLPEPVTFTLKHKVIEGAKNPICAAWNFRENSWTTSGCQVMDSSPSYTKCQCDSLSQYAVLMEAMPSAEPHAAYDREQEQQEQQQANVILIASCVLIAVSTFCLVIAIAVAKRRNAFICSSKTHNVDTDGFYPASSTASSASSDYQQRRQNVIYKSSLIGQNKSAMVPLSAAELYGHIYAEIDQAYFESSSSSTTSSEDNRPQSTARLLTHRPQQQQQQQPQIPHLLVSRQYQEAQPQQQVRRPSTITLQDGDQFVRLRLEDPYAANQRRQQQQVFLV